ncbi:hypothetical protein ASG40_03360 [Methylobacterium sp. Leaf399]|uniref:hypothetical protein n=1 Tax=Methylobacterium sp. Leaf399 TaxID=1736364 RepID=UPI000714FFAC|nr:hypothetical protein [Methylobacterium sp. Leaf399]KQT19858.1 hypothetical protein ASG40_03360 [Methylobacterium sp. Leaf399]
MGLVTYFDEMVAYLLPPDPNTAPALAPDPRRLVIGLPYGPISYARYVDVDEEVPNAPAIFFAINHGNNRLLTHAGFLLLRVLSLSGGLPYEREAAHGIEVLAPGFTLTRLMADADDDEVVRLQEGHVDLRPWCLLVERGRPWAGRRHQDAIRYAVRRYRDRVEEWGLTALLPPEGYEAMLKGAFRMFDVEHAMHFLRPLDGEKVVSAKSKG